MQVLDFTSCEPNKMPEKVNISDSLILNTMWKLETWFK
jgi:hypothetical protein